MTFDRCNELITHAIGCSMPIFKILTVAFLMVYASGCGCTEVGCSDGLEISLQKGADTWEPGKYVFTVDLDGTKSSCTATLPGASDMDCTAVIHVMTKSKTPDSSSAEAIPDSVLTSVAATHVTLTITRDGAEVARKDFSPSYAEQQPNGDFCGPTCKVAKDTLAIP